MWNLSSSTRDQTCAPDIGSSDMQPLDHQGSRTTDNFKNKVSVWWNCGFRDNVFLWLFALKAH